MFVVAGLTSAPLKRDASVQPQPFPQSRVKLRVAFEAARLVQLGAGGMALRALGEPLERVVGARQFPRRKKVSRS